MKSFARPSVVNMNCKTEHSVTRAYLTNLGGNLGRCRAYSFKPALRSPSMKRSTKAGFADGRVALWALREDSG